MADYRAVKMIKNWVEYFFPSGWGSSCPTVDLLVVAWWGAWGSASYTGYCGWWWGGWEVLQYYCYPLEENSYCVFIWGGASGTKLCPWGNWWNSCFGGVVAYWWWWGWAWTNWASAWTLWRNWWNWWWGGGNLAAGLCCTLWWYSTHFWNAWWRGGLCIWWWGWGAWWPWIAMYSSNYGWIWWPWITSDIPCKNNWCLYWTWWSPYYWLFYPWWWCNQWPATFYWWWGGWAMCSCAWWAWCKWIVYVRYKTWGQINSSTWGNCCYTCDGYCIHEFTSNWTFSIS